MKNVLISFLLSISGGMYVYGWIEENLLVIVISLILMMIGNFILSKK